MKEKVINFRSCFDVIGPIMVGPSSSHTAGALQIGLLARALMKGTPEKICCKYYESFAQTHKGHGTDFAIVAGILGFPTDDERVPNAVEIAKERGIEITFVEKLGESPAKHANTADITVWKNGEKIRILGVSIGGGAVEVRLIELDGVEIVLQGPLPILIEKVEAEHHSNMLSLLQQHQAIIRQSQLVGNEDILFRIVELKSLLSPQLQKALQQLEQLYILV